MENLLIIGLLSIPYSMIVTLIIIDKCKEISKLKYKLFRYKSRIDYLQDEREYIQNELNNYKSMNIKIIKPNKARIMKLQGSDKE